jgi:hypothetical protein
MKDLSHPKITREDVIHELENGLWNYPRNMMAFYGKVKKVYETENSPDYSIKDAVEYVANDWMLGQREDPLDFYSKTRHEDIYKTKMR